MQNYESQDMSKEWRAVKPYLIAQGNFKIGKRLNKDNLPHVTKLRSAYVHLSPTKYSLPSKTLFNTMVTRMTSFA